jgi:tetratricopeptide (TPR) repeat protein
MTGQFLPQYLQLWYIIPLFVLLGCSSSELPTNTTPSPSAVEQFNKGRAHILKEEYEQAITPLNQAIQLHPTYVEAYYFRGTAYYNLGQFYAALADHDRAIQLKPDFVDAYYGRGAAHDALGYREQAVADFERYLSEATDPYWRKRAEEVVKKLRN